MWSRGARWPEQRDYRSASNCFAVVGACLLFVSSWDGAFAPGRLSSAGRAGAPPRARVIRNGLSGRERAGWGITGMEPLRETSYSNADKPSFDTLDWKPYTNFRGETSYRPTKENQADDLRRWYLFDAAGKTLGHLAVAIALVLRGKDSTLYDIRGDVGHYCVVTNCEKVKVSGKKYKEKLYFRNLSKRPSGIKVERFYEVQRRFPERIIMAAVWGAMPKKPGCRRIFQERLKIYVGPDHLHHEEDITPYPMHLIKDCTPTSSLPPRRRIRHIIERTEPMRAAKALAQAEQEKEERLANYKEYLKSLIPDGGA